MKSNISDNRDDILQELQEVVGELKLLKNDLDNDKKRRYYLEERVRWLEKKLNIKCHHANIKYSRNDYEHYICQDCGREWDKTNFLSD